MRLHAAGVAMILAVGTGRLPAQTLDDLTAGVRVRVYGFEATPQGDRKYEATGQVAGRDPVRLVIIRDAATKFDTLPLLCNDDSTVESG